MKVRALELGFYGGSRRRKGSVFEVEDGEKASWFEPLEGETKKAPAKGKGKASTQSKAQSGQVQKPAGGDSNSAGDNGEAGDLV